MQEQGTLISLNVDIRAPIVLVPQNSESTNLLAFKLGDLSLKNFFEDTEVSPGVNQNWDHMYLHLDSVQMLRYTLILRHCKGILHVLHIFEIAHEITTELGMAKLLKYTLSLQTCLKCS